MKYLIGLAVIAFGFLVGCGSSGGGIPDVTPAMAKKYDVDEVTLARGRRIYMAHCAKCHQRVEPGKIDPEFWRSVTPHMALKANISKSEEKQLLQYLMVAHSEVHGLE